MDVTVARSIITLSTSHPYPSTLPHIYDGISLLLSPFLSEAGGSPRSTLPKFPLSSYSSLTIDSIFSIFSVGESYTYPVPFTLFSVRPLLKHLGIAASSKQAPPLSPFNCSSSCHQKHLSFSLGLGCPASLLLLDIFQRSTPGFVRDHSLAIVITIVENQGCIQDTSCANTRYTHNNTSVSHTH